MSSGASCMACRHPVEVWVLDQLGMCVHGRTIPMERVTYQTCGCGVAVIVKRELLGDTC